MARVAVWGARGFIGHHVMSRLSVRGHVVRALARNPGESDVWPHGVETGALQFRDPPENYRAAVGGCDYAIHCAGHAQDPTAFAEFERSTAEFVRAAGAEKLKRVFLLSTVAVYGTSSEGIVGTESPLRGESAYAKSRIRAERLAREAGAGSATQVVAIRVPAVVGVGMPGTVLARFFGAIRRGVFFHPGSADAVFGCIGVRRLADCMRATIEAPSVPDACQFADNIAWTALAQLFSEASGRRIVRVPLPARGLAAGARMFGMEKVSHAIGVLNNRLHYQDDTARPALSPDPGVPSTVDDLRAVIADYLQSIRRAA